jgi:AraC-like DNA-binding protein
MLKDVLILDAQGNPIPQDHKTFSKDWDEIRAWSDSVYMPYRVSPIQKGDLPTSTMHSLNIGRITVTRFAYGIPVNICDWDQDYGNALVLTTIRGTAQHFLNKRDTAETKVGESFVADCSRVDYDVNFDPDHLQVNLTIPHKLLEDVSKDWFGFVPGDQLWQHKTRIGGSHSSWLAMMEFLARQISESPDLLARERVAKHMEQTICVALLNEWADRAGIDLHSPTHQLAPKAVKLAEEYMTNHAMHMPSMTEVARASGVSLRTLSGSFKKFRGYSPSAFLRERRLLGIRQHLLNSGPELTVSQIAYAWGWVSLGIFAKAYKERFGELPSQTLKKS